MRGIQMNWDKIKPVFWGAIGGAIALSIIGFAWGAFDALIAGAIFAWLYNTIAERFFAEKEPQGQG